MVNDKYSMNYINHYNRLIERAKYRVLSVYTERHHIIPVCMNGPDTKENIAELTPEEHYVAHQLLVKIYPENHRLIHAATMMTVYSKSNIGRSKNKLFGWLKRRLSETMKQNTGDKNSQFGSCWIHNITDKVSKKISKISLPCYLSQGWQVGRVMNFDKSIKLDKRQIIKDATDIRYLDALNKSVSISEALRYLKLQTRGAGYTRMKRVIQKYNLKDKFSHEYIKWEQTPGCKL